MEMKSASVGLRRAAKGFSAYPQEGDHGKEMPSEGRLLCLSPMTSTRVSLNSLTTDLPAIRLKVSPGGETISSGRSCKHIL